MCDPVAYNPEPGGDSKQCHSTQWGILTQYPAPTETPGNKRIRSNRKEKKCFVFMVTSRLNDSVSIEKVDCKTRGNFFRGVG
jgi:hypothetical protein